MVLGLKIIEWRWLNDPKTIEKTIKSNGQLVKKVVNDDGQRVAKLSKIH